MAIKKLHIVLLSMQMKLVILHLNGQVLKILGYIVSFRSELDAKSLLAEARANWSVENNLYCQLDVSMNEGACRIKMNNSTENLAAAIDKKLFQYFL